MSPIVCAPVPLTVRTVHLTLFNGSCYSFFSWISGPDVLSCWQHDTCSSGVTLLLGYWHVGDSLFWTFHTKRKQRWGLYLRQCWLSYMPIGSILHSRQETMIVSSGLSCVQSIVLDCGLCHGQYPPPLITSCCNEQSALTNVFAVVWLQH